MASFYCPGCNRPTMAIQRSLELSPDADNDEITLQTLACTGCGAQGCAIYRESRRGASESWYHDGYILDPDAFADLSARLDRCPSPRERRCDCETHRFFGGTDERGGWRGHERLPIDRQRSFSMRIG